jgi:hypothetical protein
MLADERRNGINATYIGLTVVNQATEDRAIRRNGFCSKFLVRKTSFHRFVVLASFAPLREFFLTQRRKARKSATSARGRGDLIYQENKFFQSCNAECSHA